MKKHDLIRSSKDHVECGRSFVSFEKSSSLSLFDHSVDLAGSTSIVVPCERCWMSIVSHVEPSCSGVRIKTVKGPEKE